MNNITLYDLMAEDLEVWVTRSKKFGFDLQIENENGETIVNEEGVHPYAMESFAAMCRQFLYFYEKSNTQLEVA